MTGSFWPGLMLFTAVFAALNAVAAALSGGWPLFVAMTTVSLASFAMWRTDWRR